MDVQKCAAQHGNLWDLTSKETEMPDTSLLKSLIFRVGIRFLLHEAWVLRTAQLYPLLSIYAFITLWIWLIAAGLPISLLVLVLMEFGGRLATVISIFPAAAGLILIIPWLFRWYFICAGLMFGKGILAKRKEIELSQRLERLKQCLRQ